ncbi:MAG: UTP--glucose-1-phosphate uridylyltransferase [Bdellovibrionales bacterium]|nr:UTP--glucose-1-phosphate uridylyltransferase [Bdellovibrionales bacterium]
MLEEIRTQIRTAFQKSGQPEIIERTFLQQVEYVSSGKSAFISSAEIEPVLNPTRLEELSQFEKAGSDALAGLVVCKLNGGLGTSMGLEKAKSLLSVRDGYSFLDIMIEQVKWERKRSGASLPFLCMNSFRTERDTLDVLKPDFNGSTLPLSMLQHQVPKIDSQTFLPAQCAEDPELEWCPPGHGDLYPVLISSGVLKKALSLGFEYLFVSNSDNLGATISLPLLGYLSEKNIPFLMEVAERTVSDRKGGHLARTKDGQLILRERAQVAPGDEEDFQDYRKYTSFNTNSLWLNLRALDALLEEHGQVLPLPVIRNEKPLNPREPSSQRVLQLETAMGSAIHLFPGAEAVLVPRSRFAPVKTTEDLMRIRSDLFTLSEDFQLRSVLDKEAIPITLDPRFYGKIDDFEARFPDGIPQLRNATSLTIEGDVQFGSHAVCRGEVLVKNAGTQQQKILPDTVLEGEVVLFGKS